MRLSNKIAISLAAFVLFSLLCILSLFAAEAPKRPHILIIYGTPTEQEIAICAKDENCMDIMSVEESGLPIRDDLKCTTSACEPYGFCGRDGFCKPD